MAMIKSNGPIWGLEFNRCVCFLLRGNGTIFGKIYRIPYLTLKIQGQGHDENLPKSYQINYGSGPSIPPKMKETLKVVQKLMRKKDSAAGGGGAGAGLRTVTKT